MPGFLILGVQGWAHSESERWGFGPGLLTDLQVAVFCSVNPISCRRLIRLLFRDICILIKSSVRPQWGKSHIFNNEVPSTRKGHRGGQGGQFRPSLPVYLTLTLPCWGPQLPSSLQCSKQVFLSPVTPGSGNPCTPIPPGQYGILVV